MKPRKTLLTTVVIILALFQAPYIYYYCDGILGVIQVIPYSLLGLGLTILLFYLLRKDKQSFSLHHVGAWLAIVLGVLSLSPSEDLFERLDWEFRFYQRQKIVNEIKDGKLVPDYGETLYKLPYYYFPPISVGGNEIAISKDSTVIAVEFFINRGFLDHYSAFKYTNNQKEIASFDSLIKNHGNRNYRKLAANWYRVSY